MSRYPRTVLGTVCLPWAEDDSLDEALFRRTIGNLVCAGLPDLYVFGTAGEGYAVTDGMYLPPFAAGDAGAGGGMNLLGVWATSVWVVKRFEHGARG